MISDLYGRFKVYNVYSERVKVSVGIIWFKFLWLIHLLISCSHYTWINCQCLVVTILSIFQLNIKHIASQIITIPGSNFACDNTDSIWRVIRRILNKPVVHSYEPFLLANINCFEFKFLWHSFSGWNFTNKIDRGRRTP